MSDLDEKLRKIAHRIMVLDPKADYGMYLPEYIDLIKQAFIDAGYITPEQVKKTQELINQMANLANDMAKQPVVVWNDPGKLSELMTGQEWYDRFLLQLPRPTKMRRFRSDTWYTIFEVFKAAKKAAGLE